MKFRNIRFLPMAFITGVLLLSQCLMAQQSSAYEKKWLIQQTDTLPYRLLLPENYNKDSAYPLVLFLHGAGERGSDNELQLTHGSKLFERPDNRQKFPAIVVFPQCPKSSFWSNVNITYDTSGKRTFNFPVEGEPTKAMQMVLNLMKQLGEEFRVKKEQVYVMGLSMGGMGTFEIVRRMPATFAAAVPICGGANPATSSKIKHTAFWIFHGAKDEVVPMSLSENMMRAIQKHYDGAEMQYTIYPEANHNSWDQAFAEPTLLTWIFSQKRIK